ncbi:B3 domain-containing transcription factor FUS3-like [Impatiens glandulifera]|uniref:B3 domain-containing transcription factor FUS3-like n=1 Tax=Impatiens glandulifera TaxID=253017 RepID=UPI001FB19CD8|nr:B3 domain-containing transcription factor FUS3-like [Impatiens glandulifera]
MGKTEACGAAVVIGESSERVRTRDQEESESDQTELTPCDLLLSATVKRKRRMARHKRSAAVKFHLFAPFASPPPLSNARVTPRLKFLFQKELRMSDVSALRRMVIPKKAAESYLPELSEREGVVIKMDDIDGHRSWSFKFRYWPNNTSRMYVLENTGEFVNAHGLKQGDYIMLYKEIDSQKYVIRGRKAGEHVFHDESAMYCVHDDVEFSGNGISSLPSLSGELETCYVYDTTPCHDDLFDFWNGPMIHNSSSSSKAEPFGSFDNSTLDEVFLSL